MSQKLERRKSLIQGLEVRAKKEGSASPGTLVGYAAVFNSRSEDLGGFIEVIKPGAFARSLGEGEDIYAFCDHDASSRLARTKSGTLRLSEDDKGLRCEIDLPDTQRGRDIYEEVRGGLLDAMSFGFRTIADEWRREGEMIFRTLVEVKLFEVSPVTWPAYPATSIDARCLDQVREMTKPPAPVPAPKKIDVKRMIMRARLAARS